MDHRGQIGHLDHTGHAAHDTKTASALRRHWRWVVGGLAGAAALTLGAIGVADAVISSPRTLWSTQFGTSEVDLAAAVATAPNGDIYVYGQTGGEVETGTDGTDTDVFLARYDKSGSRKWIRQLGTTGDDFPANQIAVAPNGDVYIAGTAGAEAEFPQNASEGGQDIFIAKYNKEGSLRWVRQWGADADDQAYGIARSSTGDLYVAVETTSVLLDGSRPPNSYVGKMDSALVKFNRDGRFQWANQFGTAEDDWVWGVTVSAQNEIYVAGTTYADLDGVGDQVFNGSDVTKGDGFLIRFDRNGSRKWLRQFGTTEDDQFYGVATNRTGDVFVSGFTSGEMVTDQDKGGTDGVVLKYSKEGTLRWGNQHGSPADDFGWSISIARNGKISVGGYTTGAMDTYTNAGDEDVYTARISTDGLAVSYRQFGTAARDGGRLDDDTYSVYGSPVVVAPNGTMVVVGTTEGATWGLRHAGAADVFVTVIP